jgi:hypothetical protein
MATMQQLSSGPDREKQRTLYGTGATPTLYWVNQLGQITVTDTTDIAYFKALGWVQTA